MTTIDVNTTTVKRLTDSFFAIANDLATIMPAKERYQRLLKHIRDVVPSDASALLRYENGKLYPLAVDGLTADTLGRSFIPEEHPRLNRILHSERPVR